MPSKSEDPVVERLTEPQHPDATELFALWRSKCGDNGQLPSREDLTLKELWALRCADRSFILEPLPDGDWQYRLLGSRITQFYGRDVSNIPFRQHMSPDEAEASIALSNEAARDRKPVFLRMRYVGKTYSGIIETMSLPILARDGKTVWLFGASFFTNE
ncbi:PAS domain-containing protein [Rhodospirillaceae bacterium KN72]|uniref:PAS domain-containing protein n=1 Tax=Pacificispira spongiicola TaxID=2729598 RepID=A0A7Y0DZ22_9PROT|nr:PAS domain-containing protein [Pacificispira spongiicola]NMM44118.1 PAS domain-containing protein [Pacificispira spongiicola]